MNAIDYLHELFKLRILKEEKDYIFEEEKCIILLHIVAFEDLLYKVMASLRTYCKHDVIIVKKILLFLKDLKTYTSKDDKIKIINKEIENFLADAKIAITNKTDLEKLENI